MNYDLARMAHSEWVEADGLGLISEVAGADRPHTPRRGLFQAWSLAELLCLDLVVLADEKP